MNAHLKLLFERIINESTVELIQINTMTKIESFTSRRTLMVQVYSFEQYLSWDFNQ